MILQEDREKVVFSRKSGKKARFMCVKQVIPYLSFNLDRPSLDRCLETDTTVLASEALAL